MKKKAIKKKNFRPPFKSKNEQNFFDYPGAFEVAIDAKIEKMIYETLVFVLQTGEKTLKYTPDFYVLTDDNQVVLIEVKASRRAKGFYYSRARLQACSIKFPEFRWLLAIQKPRSTTEWVFEEF